VVLVAVQHLENHQQLLQQADLVIHRPHRLRRDQTAAPDDLILLQILVAQVVAARQRLVKHQTDRQQEPVAMVRLPQFLVRRLLMLAVVVEEGIKGALRLAELAAQAVVEREVTQHQR
jgi:hypothetical protein